MDKDQKDNKKHVCPMPGNHCCQCDGCGRDCKHGKTCVRCDGSRDEVMSQYWTKNFIVLVLGIVAAFFIGYNLGKMKGFIMANFASGPMHNRAILFRDLD